MNDPSADDADTRTETELRALIEAVKDQIPNTDRLSIEELIWAGEPTVAIECLAGSIAALRQEVDEAWYQRSVAMGEGLDADLSFWDGIVIAGRGEARTHHEETSD